MITRGLAAAYVLTIATMTTVGFVTDSPAPILVAGVLSLPTSVPAGIGFYVVFGLLAQVPGANPSTSSGSMSCTSAGECHGSSSGEAATWFLVTTDVVGILALTLAAVLNVLIVGRLVRGRRAASDRTRSGALP
ncbi:hypothetical protein ASC77_17545 [Nocardioides sp. Root1257]|uniref:hypothetical protein n=1 Tax=unclassified Nocardioides TaxID=2615069 RepID=UPI0006F9FD05|nr:MULTISPECIES: hypothetical protein [unclassified Nocardioides]KQW46992.1 hypothetical protein ASC77_17545 [Nocardioides sp. Root1257]KRC43738.1 hypothetical protein ASE24_18500 [Nocardioides sp. Root224]